MHYVLYLRAEFAELWLCGRGFAPRSLGMMRDGEPAVQSVGRLLPQSPRRACVVLADLVAEEFHYEAGPRLRWPWRRAWLARRLLRRYGEQSYRRGDSLGRGLNTGRGSLLRALLDDTAIDAWSQALEDCGIPVYGVFSIADALEWRWARRQDREVRIVAFADDEYRVRLCLFNDGRVVLSRLLPAMDSPSPEWWSWLHEEIAETWIYARRQGVPGLDAVPTAIVVASTPLPDPPPALASAMQCMSVQAFHGKQGESSLLPGLIAVATHLRGGGYLSAPSPLARSSRAATRLRAVAVAAMLISLAGVLSSLAEAWSLSRTERLLGLRLHQLQQKTALLATKIPVTQHSPVVMAATLQRLQRIANTEPLPPGLLQGLAAALTAVPVMELAELRWARVDMADAAIWHLDDQPLSPLQPKDRLVLISGHIIATGVDLQQRQMELRQLCERLDAQPGYHAAQLVQRPVAADDVVSGGYQGNGQEAPLVAVIRAVFRD